FAWLPFTWRLARGAPENASLFHRTWPSFALRQRRRQEWTPLSSTGSVLPSSPSTISGVLSVTAEVTKMRSFHTTGLEWPAPGSAAFHRTFVRAATSQVVGRFWPSETPRASGPRKVGQVSANAAGVRSSGSTANDRAAGQGRRVFIVVSSAIARARPMILPEAATAAAENFATPAFKALETLSRGLAHADDVLVRADEDLAARDRGGGGAPLVESIALQDARLASRLQHDRVAGLADEVDLAVAAH